MARGGATGGPATLDLKKDLNPSNPKGDGFSAHGVPKGPHTINGDAVRTSTAASPTASGPRSEG